MATSIKAAAASWHLDAGTATPITKPDSTVDIDTRNLAEGRHTVVFRSSNPVGFTGLASFA